MSYLSAPRLVFSGLFQADPSTVNNDPEHFDSDSFRTSYQLPGSGASNGWWNPRGTGAWRLRDCTVQQVVYADGSVCDDPNVDPIVGASVNDAEMRVEGKLVDLDPEQQMVSEIWGLRVIVGGGRGGPGFASDFEVTPFADIWTRFPKGQPDSFFGAFYQGTLRVGSWGGAGSRFMDELRGGGDPADLLSIRFNVDGYNDDRGTTLFTFGRVVGSIGRYLAGEPHHFVAGRALQALPGSPLNTAYAVLDGGVLTVDLGNSLPTQSAGGPLADLGRLYAALLPAQGAPVLLGEIDYRDAGWYEGTAGIASFRLSAAQAGQAANTPLGIVQWGTSPLGFGGFQPLLAEAPDGSWMRADDFVFRLDPGETATTTFHAARFGVPVGGVQISLGYDATVMQTQTQQGPLPGPTRVGQPESALTFSTTFSTDPDGTATLTLVAADPGNPRGYIDGQVYGVTYALGGSPPPLGSVQNPSQLLNALVFSGYAAPAEPNWLDDVQPIFQQYANLYPIMRPIVDLADYGSVMEKLSILQAVFDTPVENPNYMPVTRDLSTARRNMLRKWLDAPVYMRLDSVEDVMAALQQAVELEHATIPPYLCALYSIKEGTNAEVAELIRSVMMEEMLHMTLSSNLLISIGGAPRIGHPGFVPRYPGPLPGGLRAGLTVRLRRASIEQIREVFLSIEEPEETVDPVHAGAQPGDPTMQNQFTIGWFYQEIERALTELSGAGKITFGNVEKQVSEWDGPGNLYVIRSLDDAKAAIGEIKEQGEGATPYDPDDADHELAHYYRFAEIVHGRRIVVTPTGYSFTGDPLPFDPAGVWPMMDDPQRALLPPGSRAAILSEQFSRTYQALLNGLHRTFNGEPSYLREAIGLMYSLSLTARDLMQTPSGLPDGTTAGPSFELP